MADVAKGVVPSISTSRPSAEHQITGLLAGEDIDGGDACYIDSTTGYAMLADGSAADEEARVVGFAARASKSGQAVTLWHHVNFAYSPHVSGTACPPGTPLFLSATTPGGLGNAATTGGAVAIAFAIGDGRIFAKGNY